MIAGMADGACRAEVEAAAESTDPFDISARFTDPSYGLGDAQALLDCMGINCADLCL
jgi:hypothetical protein